MEHVQRYEFASSHQYAKGKRVLDIACGTGRGSRLLAEMGCAAEVIGCDIEADAIRYARTRNAHPHLGFLVCDALTFHSDTPFDLIVCFETIEHLCNPEILLRNLAALLKPEGRLFISTPVANSEFDSTPNNPHHRQEWGLQSFQQLLSKSFDTKKIYLQGNMLPAPRNVALRALSKLFRQSEPGSSPTYRKPVMPLWEELTELGISLDRKHGRWSGYQIVECSLPQ